MKKHGYKLMNVLFVKYLQLGGKNIFDPQRVDSFTREAKMEEIHLTTMLKENICGKFKAKSCADVRKQQRYFSKEEEVSPTI